MFPELSIARPVGELKPAEVPVLSALPEWPNDPANVVTTPIGVILRIAWFELSATYTLLPASTTTPEGNRNLAALPVPSTAPATPGDPARVVTTPEGEIFRMV